MRSIYFCHRKNEREEGGEREDGGGKGERKGEKGKVEGERGEGRRERGEGRRERREGKNGVILDTALLDVGKGIELSRSRCFFLGWLGFVTW